MPLSAEDWTDEQRERARRNRERALEIQRRKRLEREEAAKLESEEKESNKKQKTLPGDKDQKEEDGDEDKNSEKKEEETQQDDEPLEDFEVGASEFVTQTEATKVYLLPMGTLRVCDFVERQNPRNKQFKPMKLYRRSEVRRRARQRFGGLAGLIQERHKRQDEQFERDLAKTKNMFG